LKYTKYYCKEVMSNETITELEDPAWYEDWNLKILSRLTHPLTLCKEIIA